jgi:hypothetical protein
MSPLITVARYIMDVVGLLGLYSSLAIKIALGVFVALVLIRYLLDRFSKNPFGKLTFYLRKPTNKWFYEVKNSQFYYPARQAFGFDPSWLLLILGAACFFYLLSSLISQVLMWLQSVGVTLLYFGSGRTLAGVWALVGLVLLALLYFLMILMTILVINAWFGFFRNASVWAGRKIYPLLASFDPSGRLGPIIFFIAFLLLGFVAGAVQAGFF